MYLKQFRQHNSLRRVSDMVKDIIAKAVDGAAAVVISANDFVEDIVDEIPMVGVPLVEKVWSPITGLIGMIAYAPFKFLGLGKRY